MFGKAGPIMTLCIHPPYSKENMQLNTLVNAKLLKGLDEDENISSGYPIVLLIGYLCNIDIFNMKTCTGFIE